MVSKDILMDDKWYIINLDTNKIKPEPSFDCIFDTLHWGNGKLVNFTAVRGKYLKPDDRFSIEE